jgi:hypothetical protein
MEITAMRVSIRILAFSLVVLSSTAFAHRPTMSDGAASDADHAIEFQDVQISRVVYHEVTEQAPRVWITFEIDQPQTLFLQIGVPVLDRLRDYRPALALIGPGLPDLRLPFESPGGLGGVVIDTRDIERPRDFYEPFTKTRSWILREKDVLLPEAGRYYVVAYEPDEQPGKLWAATGRKEVWNSSDILNMSKIMTQVRRFHEVAKVSDATVKPVEQRVLFGFDGRDSNNEWTSVNDDVMGGVSEGSLSVTEKGVLEWAWSRWRITGGSPRSEVDQTRMTCRIAAGSCCGFAVMATGTPATSELTSRSRQDRTDSHLRPTRTNGRRSRCRSATSWPPHLGE